LLALAIADNGYRTVSIVSQTQTTRPRIMRAKTDTLRAIRRGQDYTTARETTLSLIEAWWSAFAANSAIANNAIANANATLPSEGDDTFASAAEETEHFLEMCDVFDADNDAATSFVASATGAFADRAHDFDTSSTASAMSVAGITASLAGTRISSVTGISSRSHRSRISYVAHPAAAQMF